MTPTSQSSSILGPSSRAKAPEAGTAVVPARLMTQQPREGPSVAEKAAASSCLPPNAQLLDRIRGEYLEMPGLKLTLPQAQRFWHLCRRECEELLGALIEVSLPKIRREVRPSQRARRLDQAAEHDEGRNRSACSSNEARSGELTRPLFVAPVTIREFSEVIIGGD